MRASELVKNDAIGIKRVFVVGEASERETLLVENQVHLPDRLEYLLKDIPKIVIVL